MNVFVSQSENFRCREKGIPIPNPEIRYEDPALTKKGRRPKKRKILDVKMETDVKVEIVDCLNPFCPFTLHPYFNRKRCGNCGTFRLGMEEDGH